ncbi:hypothetical protein ACVIWV_001213 [Bradyrhizobium diazoefficiens]
MPQRKPSGKPLSREAAAAGLASAPSRGFAIAAADNPASAANWRRETLSDM